MPHHVGIEKRQQMLGENRQHVEQAAIEIEVFVVKQRLVGETAAVEGDDQFAVVLLRLLVVGDGVGVVGEKDEQHEQGEQHPDREVIAIVARDEGAQASDRRK